MNRIPVLNNLDFCLWLVDERQYPGPVPIAGHTLPLPFRVVPRRFVLERSHAAWC